MGRGEEEGHMRPAGGESRGRPLFPGILEGPLARRSLPTTALSPGNPWPGEGLRVSTWGLHSLLSRARICFGPGRCPWGRDLLLQSTSSRSPMGFTPHLTLQGTDSCRGTRGLTHRGPQEPAIPAPRLCRLPGSPSPLRDTARRRVSLSTQVAWSRRQDYPPGNLSPGSLQTT